MKTLIAAVILFTLTGAANAQSGVGPSSYFGPTGGSTYPSGEAFRYQAPRNAAAPTYQARQTVRAKRRAR
jgi:hypothetical protein